MQKIISALSSFVSSRLSGYLSIAIVALAVCAAFWIKSLRSDLAEVKSQSATYAEHFSQCEKNKKIASEVSHEYQAKNMALDKQLRDLRELHSNMRIQINNPARGHNAAATEGKFSGSDAIEAGWLIEQSGEAERTRLRLLACQGYLRRIAE